MISDNYPSLISENSYGLCLRASQKLVPNTIVASKDLVPTNNHYIANHLSPEYKYVMVMGLDDNNQMLWGKVTGKAAYVNHSCDANCESNGNYIYTMKNVEKDAELTISYDNFIPNIEWDYTWDFVCLCGEDNCRKIINSYKSE